MHGLVTFLVCVVLFRLFRLVSPALLGGLFFGLNPALSSSVVWISGRNYLLAMLFLLLSFYALLRGEATRDKPQATSNKPQNGAWRLLFAVSFLLAILAHETSIVFLLIAVAWILRKPGNANAHRIWLMAVASPVIVYLVLRLGVARVPFVPEALHDIISQPLVALNSFGQEMLVLFVPFIQKVMYAANPSFSGYSVLGILFLGSPLYFVAVGGGRLWLGYAWMVLFLLPFANLTAWGPSGRMLYISGLGSLMILLGFGRLKTVAAVLAAVYCVALGAWTLKRNPIWKDETTLYQATVREAPQSQCAHLYRADSLETAGQLDAAVFEYRAAIAADPDLVGALLQTGEHSI